MPRQLTNNILRRTIKIWGANRIGDPSSPYFESMGIQYSTINYYYS